MSVFKVGQRVRRIAFNRAGLNKENFVPGWPCPPIGAEGVIARLRYDGDYSVVYDKYPTHPDHAYWHAEAGTLAPLTDPKADAFIESVKKWKPEPVVPLPAKVKA